MDFIRITFVDILDIVLVAMLMYYLYKVLRGTHAMSILSGILLLFVVYIVVSDENPHENFRQMIDISFPDIFFIVREDGGKTSVFILAFDFLHFVRIHPGMSRKYAPFFAFFQIYFVHIS